MQYRLFDAEGSASKGIQIILEEIGADYLLIPTTTDRTKPRSKEHLALNPNGWVPVLTWKNSSMYEAAAITIFLCDKYPIYELAPGVESDKRALYLQTLAYFSSSVQNAFQLDYYPDRFTDNHKFEGNAQRRGHRRLRETWRIVDKQIGKNKFILGDKFSAADIYMFMLTTWLKPSRGQPSVSEFPNVERIAHEVSLRKSIKRVYPNYKKI